MALFSWSNNKPEKGKYTVATVTKYSSGESEITTTTIHEPLVYKKRIIEKDEFFGIVGKKGRAAEREMGFDEAQLSVIDKEDNKMRSLRRTRSTIRKKIIEGNLDHFLTLTYRENKQDIKDCWKDWKKFIRLVQKKYPKIKYLVIVERQKRGAVHFHAAVSGYMHANSTRALWQSVVGEGNIDIKQRQRNQSMHGLAKYITKYLTKQYDELESFQNLYRCSRNIKLNQIKIYLLQQYNGIAFAEIDQLIKYFIPRALQHWEDRNGLFNCTWSSSLSPN